MKIIAVVLVLLVTQTHNVNAIGNCYVYSPDEQKQAQCEKDYIAQHQEWAAQENQFNQAIIQTKIDHQNAVDSDSSIAIQNSLNDLINQLKKDNQEPRQ